MASVSTQTGSTRPTATPAVEPSLLEAFRKFTAAFNRQEVKEVAAFWLEDGTLIGPTGNRGIGRSGVERVYAEDLEQFLRGTRSAFAIESVRVLGRDLALLDLEHSIEGARMPDGNRGTLNLHLVVLARREGAEWRWLDCRPYGFLPRTPTAPLH